MTKYKIMRRNRQNNGDWERDPHHKFNEYAKPVGQALINTLHSTVFEYQLEPIKHKCRWNGCGVIIPRRGYCSSHEHHGVSGNIV